MYEAHWVCCITVIGLDLEFVSDQTMSNSTQDTKIDLCVISHEDENCSCLSLSVNHRGHPTPIWFCGPPPVFSLEVKCHSLYLGPSHIHPLATMGRCTNKHSLLEA